MQYTYNAKKICTVLPSTYSDMRIRIVGYCVLKLLGKPFTAY